VYSLTSLAAFVCLLALASAVGCTDSDSATDDVKGARSPEQSTRDSSSVPTTDTAHPPIEDRFEQKTPSVDVLLIIDDSGAGPDWQLQTATEIAPLFDKLAAVHADFHLGVTGASVHRPDIRFCVGKESLSGRLNTGTWIDASTPSPKDALSKLVDMGSGAWSCDVPLYVTMLALIEHADGPNQGFHRATADQHVVYVGRNDDHAHDDVTTRQVYDYLTAIADTGAEAKMHAITCVDKVDCLGPARRVGDVVVQTGGQLIDANQASESKVWASIIDDIVPEPQLTYDLTERADATTVEVQIERTGGTVDLLSEADGDYSLNPAGGKLTLTTAPVPGDVVVVTYLPAP